MPMWVAGHSEPAQSGPGLAARGFSLIEVLVVLMVVASTMALAALSLGNLRGRGLDLEAQRLNARLGAASEEARLDGRTIRFELDDRGYRFYRLQLGRWSLIQDDVLLQPRSWDQFTQWYPATDAPDQGQYTPARTGGQSFELLIGHEPIASPWVLLLSRGAQRIRLVSDGVRPLRWQNLGG